VSAVRVRHWASLQALSSLADHALGARTLETPSASYVSVACGYLEIYMYKMYSVSSSSKMDFLELVKIAPPSLGAIEARIKNMPVNMFDQVLPVQQALLDDYLLRNFYNGKVSKLAADFDLLQYLFGADFMRKMLGLPVLPDSDVDLLSNAELALQDFYEKRLDIPKRGVRRDTRFEDEPKPPVLVNLTDKWEVLRVYVGTYGYREIAKEIRRFLELGEIGIEPEERQEMREIFRRMGTDIAYMGYEERIHTRLIYCEFQYKLRRADWKNLYDLDKSSALYRRIFAEAGIAMLPTEREIVRRWCVRRYGLPEDPRLVRAYQRVVDLKEIVERRMLTTEQYRQYRIIKRGNWKRAIERYTGTRCDICDAEARYICTNCSISYCETHRH
jgi:hypothetical protein